MIASRAVKVYTLCRQSKEQYVTTVFSPEDASTLGVRLGQDDDIVAVRYRNTAGKILSTYRVNKLKREGRPTRRFS